MKLFFRTLGEKDRPLFIILHGLCSSSADWLPVGTILAEKGFCVEIPDFRDHGESPWSQKLDYQELAEDFLQYWRSGSKKPFFVLGHSLGGKLAMLLATRYAKEFQGGLCGLCAVDIAPKAYIPNYQQELRACLELNLAKITSINEAEEELRQYIPNKTFRTLLLKNLRQDGRRFRWSCNFELILRDLPLLANNPLDKNDLSDIPALFLRAEKARYLLPEDLSLIHEHFPAAKMEALPCGHNAHIEAPQLLAEKASKWAEANRF